MICIFHWAAIWLLVAFDIERWIQDEGFDCSAAEWVKTRVLVSRYAPQLPAPAVISIFNLLPLQALGAYYYGVQICVLDNEGLVLPPAFSVSPYISPPSVQFFSPFTEQFDPPPAITLERAAVLRERRNLIPRTLHQMPSATHHPPPPIPVPIPKSPPSSSAASLAASSCTKKSSRSSYRVRAERTRPRTSVVAGRVHPQVLTPKPARGIAPPITHRRQDSGFYPSYSVEISGGPGSDYTIETPSRASTPEHKRRSSRSCHRSGIRRKLRRPSQFPQAPLCPLLLS